MDHIDHIDRTKDWRFPLWLQRTWVSEFFPCFFRNSADAIRQGLWDLLWSDQFPEEFQPSRDALHVLPCLATPCDVQETGSSMVHLDHGPLGRFLQSLLPTRRPSLQPSVDVMKMTRQGHNRDTENWWNLKRSNRSWFESVTSHWTISRKWPVWKQLFFSPRFKPGTVNEHGQAIQKSPVELPRVAAVASGSPPGHGSQARGPSGLRQEMRRPGACLRSSQGGETQEFCTCSVLFLRNFKNCSVHYLYMSLHSLLCTAHSHCTAAMCHALCDALWPCLFNSLWCRLTDLQPPMASKLSQKSQKSGRSMRSVESLRRGLLSSWRWHGFFRT